MLDQGRPLRIAVFSDSALPILNGVSVSIDGLVRGLRERGHSVHVFTSAHFGYRDPDPNTYRFPALTTPWTRGYPISVPPFYPMIRHFRRTNFDVIHTHTPWVIGFVGLRWAQSHGVPVVSTYHTHYDKYSHYLPFIPKRYARYKIAKHTNFYYNSVQQIITPSESSRRWLMRHSVKTPINVIPTGLPDPRPVDRADFRQRQGVLPGQRVLLYVGRVAREKNLKILLEAAALAFREDSSLLLWVVGDGPMRDECLELARSLGIGDRTRFFGFIPRHDVDQYYAAADLFMFSSMTETQGLVVGEAMSHGLPAVVVQGGGAQSAVEPNVTGFVVPNDPASLAGAALQVLGNEHLYAGMAREARICARQYSLGEMTERVLDIYAAAMGADLSSERQVVFR
jgi:1,2-diacylglycerol 3-alpha-glucosyltransferase